MIRRIINTFSPVLLAFFLFPSCDRDDFDDGQEPGGGEKICFEIAVGVATATQSGAQMRAATDNSYNCTFENGDEIGVFIVKGSGGLQSSDNWVDNMKMSYNNGNWTYILPTDREYYPIGETLDFYAYYPYQSSIDPLNMLFPVQTDQSSKVNFGKSYLLTAVEMNMSNSGNPVRLQFSQALTMIELTVISGGDGAKMTDRVTVTLEGCKSQLDMNLSTGTATASGSATAIGMYRMEQPDDANYRTSYTYRALIPAQDVAANTELFKFTQGIRNLSHKPTVQVIFTAGEVKPYDITLQPNLDPDHVYAFGDIYPHKGLPMGVVFEVSNEGRSGKIIHLFDSPLQKWGPEDDIETGATSDQDGEYNMEVIRSLDPDFSDYPCFGWCADIGAGWYFPAYREVQAFLSKTTRNQLNPVLMSIGGVVLGDLDISGALYGSSTEIENGEIYIASILVVDNSLYWLEKRYKFMLPVRAVRKF